MAKKYGYDEEANFKTFDDFIKFRYRDTPCQAAPESCEPREIKHVIWDADDTIWDIEPYGLASGCEPPFKRIDENTVQARCGQFGKHNTYSMTTTIKLKPSMIETIKVLNSRGIKSSIASHNNPNSVSAILDAMKILDLFDQVQCNWKPKDTMVKEILGNHGIKGSEAIFVDDNVDNVYKVHIDSGALSLVMNQDIFSPEEVLQYIKD